MEAGKTNRCYRRVVLMFVLGASLLVGNWVWGQTDDELFGDLSIDDLFEKPAFNESDSVDLEPEVSAPAEAPLEVSRMVDPSAPKQLKPAREMDIAPPPPSVSADLSAMELRKLLALRDQQIIELKTAFAEMTDEFGATVKNLGGQAGASLEGPFAELKEVVESLRKERDDLKDLVSQKDEAISELEVQNEPLQKEIETLKELVNQKDEMIIGLEEQNQSLRAEIESMEADVAQTAELRSEVLDLRMQLSALRSANEKERFILAYNMGSIYMSANRYDRAEDEFLKALEIRQDDAPLHYNLGVLYDEHLRKPKLARKHYEAFLELAPNDRDAPNVIRWLKEL